MARIFLALAHWQFCIGQMTFTLKSLSSTFTVWFGAYVPLYVVGIGIWFLYTPLMWIRNLEKFSNFFIFAMAMILLGVLTTSFYALGVIEDVNGGTHGPEYVAVN